METSVERKKIKRKIKEEVEYEKCIICGKELDIPKDTYIKDRQYYIEGTGQLCEKCYKEINQIVAKKEDLSKEEYEELFYKEIQNYKDMVQYKTKKGYEVFRRITDILFSLIAIVPATILIIVLSIIIRIDSSGNPIFTQVRVGKNGKLIKIHKLRSMNKDAESKGQRWAENEDPRVTKIGKILRKYRLDEIPQFYDVLIGNISLIGPRPEIPSLTKQFNEENPGFVTRLLVTPGLSGWAQVNGGYDITPRQKWLLDNEYIEKRGFKLYFRIFYLTIKTVFTGDGAR